MTVDHPSLRNAIERGLARPMFVLAFLFLLLFAGLVHRAREFDQTDWDSLEPRILLGGVLALWPIFLVEALVRFCLQDRERRNGKTLAACLAAGLFPPLRLASRGATRPDRMWLPWVGWRKVDYDFQKALEHAFSAPMILMAFLVLPILVVEYGWEDAIQANPTLRLVLAIGVSAIWFAFALEFIIRISAADRKRAYAAAHWIDLAVVLLPMFEFMPLLRVARITRLMRLKTLLAWVRYYRLYGLALKGWRGLLVMKLLQQLLSGSPEARLMRMKARLEVKEQQRREALADLDRELDYYRRKVEALQQSVDESLQPDAPTRD